MSAQEVTAIVVVCDIAGCDEQTEPAVNATFADEAALEAGWVFDEFQGRDMCPTHANND